MTINKRITYNNQIPSVSIMKPLVNTKPYISSHPVQPLSKLNKVTRLLNDWHSCRLPTIRDRI